LDALEQLVNVTSAAYENNENKSDTIANLVDQTKVTDSNSPVARIR